MMTWRAARTQVAQAQDAAAIGDDDDLHVVAGPVVHDVAEAAALAEAVEVHAQRLTAHACTCARMHPLSASQVGLWEILLLCSPPKMGAMEDAAT